MIFKSSQLSFSFLEIKLVRTNLRNIHSLLTADTIPRTAIARCTFGYKTRVPTKHLQTFCRIKNYLMNSQ